MANPRSGATPAAWALDALKTPASCGTPLGDDAIWKRLREAGLDEESVKRRDKAALIAYITKLETELYEYQNQMGLLILERKDLISKYEQVKGSLQSAQIEYKHEEAKRSSALAEARKREQSLEKLLGIQKECVASIEKAMHDNVVESAERKLAYESKIAEAHAMMKTALEKFDEAEKRLHVAESIEAEANRTHNTASRTLEDVQAREDELRRRLTAFKSECEAKEKEISIQRHALHESQKTLHLQQERLLEGQTLLNHREEYILVKTKALNCLEKELEEAQSKLKEECQALKAERSNFNLEVAALAAREEAIVKQESMLEKRERDLLILQEKTVCKEQDEIRRIREEHQILLEKRKNELEDEIEQRHQALKNELESREKACETREADLRAKEIAVHEREHAIELQLSALSEKQEDITSRLRLLEEKEQNISFTQKETETEVLKLQKERECILKMKQDLEETKSSLEDERKEILVFEQKIELTLEERNKLLVVENQLKEEIDSLRAQKSALVAEADRLKAEKDKFETEWELIDEKKADLRKEAERIEEERKDMTQYLKNERDSIKLEKENLNNQSKENNEHLSRERAELISEMDRQHSVWFSKIQQEREDFVRDTTIQRNEIENSIVKRREEIEAYLREKEEAFEQEKAKELRYIHSQKEMIAKQLEHVASEMQKLNAERMEIAQDREQREKEWDEMKRFTEALDLQCGKLQNQRESLHADRKEIIQEIQHLKYLEDLQIESENRALSEVQPKESKTPVRKKCQCSEDGQNLQGTSNGRSIMKVLPQGGPNVLTSTPDTKSWIRKCTEVLLRNSREKESDIGHQRNVHVQEVYNCQDLLITPNGTKANKHEKACGAEIVCVKHNLDEQNVISDARPVENAQSPSAVGETCKRSSQPLGGSGQKSRDIFGGVNSWLLGRKRSHDDADILSEPVQKQQKRTRENGKFELEGNSSNCMIEPQPCIGGSEPGSHNQTLKGEELHAVLDDHEDENPEVSNAKLADFSQNKLAVSNFGIVENGKSCESFEHSLSGQDLADMCASDLIAENNTPKKQDSHNEVAAELEVEDDDGGKMSVKEKLWNFLIT